MDVGTFGQYLTTLLGFSVLILVSVGAFIYVLFLGLHTKEALIIDDKPASYDDIPHKLEH